MDTPTVGRIVHYVGSHGRHLAAIIAQVGSTSDVPTKEVVGLWIFDPEKQTYNPDVGFDETGAAGTWHWPERDPFLG